MTQWFDVDKAGLAALLERRGKTWIMYELLSNAWDQKVTTVAVSLTKQAGDRYAVLSVEDDDPNGFANLSHAFTLFASSGKKGDPGQRGRFNLGEKLVLALCDDAEIISTTGGVIFDATGRHALRRKRDVGSMFKGRIKLTTSEFNELVAAMTTLIPPPNVTTTFTWQHSGTSYQRVLPLRTPLASFEATLATEIADGEGILRRTTRKTTVTVYEPLEGEVATLYELGIPVVATGHTYHVDIGQKVPLNLDRDNVSPAFLSNVCTQVMNAMHTQMTSEDLVNGTWVQDALADPNIHVEAVKSIVTARFGDRAVAFDPNDPEANKRVVAAGFTVVHGGNLSKEAWASVRRAEVLPAAGRVMPTPKPYSTDPNAPLVKVIPWDEMTEPQQRVFEAIELVSCALLGFTPVMRLVDTSNNFVAAYGSRTLDFNRRHLGKTWFTECVEAGRLTARQISLLIHELGHEFCSDHLSSKYYEALTDLGGKLAVLVAGDPALLRVGP